MRYLFESDCSTRPPCPQSSFRLPARLIPGIRTSIAAGFKLAYERGVYDGFLAGVLVTLLFVPSLRARVVKGARSCRGDICEGRWRRRGSAFWWLLALYDELSPSAMHRTTANSPTRPWWTALPTRESRLQIDLPATQHVKNFGAPADGKGLCVFASMTMAARWHHVRPLADIIHQVNEGGGWPERSTRCSRVRPRPSTSCNTKAPIPRSSTKLCPKAALPA